MKAVTAYRVSLPSPDSFPDQFELIAKGGIEFSEASTEPGAKISGRFYGTLFSFGGERIRRQKTATQKPGQRSDWLSTRSPLKAIPSMV